MSESKLIALMYMYTICTSAVKRKEEKQREREWAVNYRLVALVNEIHTQDGRVHQF